jgi:hypothetical protein
LALFTARGHRPDRLAYLPPHLLDDVARDRHGCEGAAGTVAACGISFAVRGSCVIRDPFGHEWLLGQKIQDVSPEEMQRRFSAIVSTI